MDTLAKLRQSALILLAQREHSAWELKHKLIAREYNEQDIRLVIDALMEEGLLSHFRFVESYVRMRREKGYGPTRIQAELQARGITEEAIEEHLDFADNAWLTVIRTVWHKKFKGQLPRDFKTRAYQMRFLQYRGFTPEQINTIFQSEHAS